MTKKNNIIDIGDGVFVSETTFNKRKKEALKAFVDNVIQKEFSSLNMESIIAEMIRIEFDKVKESAKRHVSYYISSETRLQVRRISEDHVNQCIRGLLAEELGKAGLEREANILVWSAIESMRNAALSAK
jgi:RNase P/RNase MRP subunit POP5